MLIDSHRLGGLVKARVEELDTNQDRRPRFFYSEEHSTPIVFATPATAEPAARAAATTNAEVEVTVQLRNSAHGFQVVSGDAETIVLQQPGPMLAKPDHPTAAGPVRVPSDR